MYCFRFKIPRLVLKLFEKPLQLGRTCSNSQKMFKNFMHTFKIDPQECSTVNKQQCSTVNEQKCSTGRICTCILRITLIGHVILVNEQKCSTVSEQKCSTVSEQQCSTVNDRQCSTVNRQQCSTVQDRQCSTSYEQECRYGLQCLHIFLRSRPV